MENLDAIVKEYLEEDSDYALLITGGWGTGKTFYYENYLVPIIEQTALGTDASKKHIPITVSLFGVKSVEELQYQILLGTIPYWWDNNWFRRNFKLRFRSKAGKLSTSIAKILSKPLLKEYSLDFLSEVLSSSKEEASNNLTFKKLVLCLDDFERKSDDLKVKDLIGFINSIVDKETGKIIIIANEDKLVDDADFKSFKEKIIGHTIEFIPEINSVYDKIVEAKFAGYPEYKKFLKNKKEFILEIFKPHSNNLRTLTFVLQKFQKVNSFIDNNVIAPNPLLNLKESIIESLLKFFISVCIEFKNGQLSYKDDKGINNKENVQLYRFLSTSNSPSKKDNNNYVIDFFNKYFENNVNTFVNSKLVFAYVTGGDILDEVKFIAELESMYNVQKNTIPEHYALFNKLRSTSLTLEDSEFDQLIENILSCVDKGAYKTSEYLEIFHLMCQNGNHTIYSSEVLKNRIIHGIETGKESNKYEEPEDFPSNWLPNGYMFEVEVGEIIEKSRKVNEEIKQREQLNTFKQAQTDFYFDIEAFYRSTTTLNHSYNQNPVFAGFDVNRLYDWVIKTVNKEKNIFRLILQKRYNLNQGSFLRDYIEEIEVLNDLEGKLKTYIDENNPTSVSGYQIKEIHKLLKDAVVKLKDTKNNIAQLNTNNLGYPETSSG